MKKLALTLICSLLVVFAFAQAETDKIIKTDGTEILCHVKEIGISEIKYTKADNPDGPVYVINKSDVRKIIFANGSEEIIQQSNMSVVPGRNRNYKRAVTTRPFGPLLGYICIGYQQALTPSRALVGEVGFIGPKISNMGKEATGGYLRIGYRLKRTPEVVMQGMEWGYNLGGFYVQPEICFSSFSSTSTGSTYNPQTGQTTTVSRTIKYNSGAFLIGVGRQMIIGEVVTFDLGVAGGYAFISDNNDQNNGFFDYRLQYFSHSALGESFPIAWKFTLSMGIMLK